MTDSQPGKFDLLGLSQPLLQALADAKYTQPTPIQEQTIPLLLEGRDVLGQAQTGTGKTAAFALPILSNIKTGGRGPKALVLLPTRELAMQVATSIESYGKHIKGLRVTCIYGGSDYRPQLRALRDGVDVLVGTPGRIMDHIKRETLRLNEVECLVLDEADEMLRMGFAEDVQWIMSHTPDAKQTILFSATMPRTIRQLSKNFMKNAEHITIKTETKTADTIRQRHYFVRYRDKPEVLGRIFGNRRHRRCACVCANPARHHRGGGLLANPWALRTGAQWRRVPAAARANRPTSSRWTSEGHCSNRRCCPWS